MMTMEGSKGRTKTSIVYASDPSASGSVASSRERQVTQVTIVGESAIISTKGPQYEVSSIRGDYESICRELRGTGKLWEDPDFPANDVSLSVNQKSPTYLQWKRPIEISDDPHFVEDGATRFDVRQGELGDCWFLAAVASLSMYKELFQHVVPENQTFDKDKYCGIFRFHFWRFGSWFEVCIDDRLPVSGNRLVYMHSVEKDEFWSALLEKAYAKLIGSYGAMRGGSAGEAMEDFTGGVNEVIDMKNNCPPNLFHIMTKANYQCSLMGCSIDAEPHEREAFLSNGLIKGHAYSVTDVAKIQTEKMGEVCLVRVRNPWGNENEWNGAWGDRSEEWDNISESEKKQLHLTFSADGEFWMSIDDFMNQFEKLEICHLGPDSMAPKDIMGRQKRRWEACIENGSWMKHVNAGGCRNFIATFWSNPQFRIKVVDADEDDEEEMGTVIIGLMQKNRRKKFVEGADFLPIGYIVYELDEISASHSKPLDINFFKYRKSVAKSPTFINLRENCARHKLKPGHYVIVPSTFQPNENADFLLRIFSEKPGESEEMDDSTESGDMHKIDDDDSRDDEESRKHHQLFKDLAGEDGQIDAYELRNILNAALRKDQNIKADEFSTETCRSMVAMLDTDKSGMLGIDEFRILWRNFKHWKSVFELRDKDKSGQFNSLELRAAMNDVGFHLSNKAFNALVLRFSNRKGFIEFDDYILCCVRLRDIFETLNSQETDQRGNGLFSLEEFMESIIYV